MNTNKKRLPTFHRPVLFGIVNITEDSFSDGGLYLDTRNAIEHGKKLAGNGADVIDLGAASSNPDSGNVDSEVEKERLAPVIHQLKKEGIPVSVDSFDPLVHRFAMEQDVDYINDITGFFHEEIYDQLSDARCKIVIMHSIQRDGIATVEDTDPRLVYDMIFQFFEERMNRLLLAGVKENRMILDPGMGFFLGSKPEASLMALRGIPEIKQNFGLPVLVSVSRKSFLGTLTDRSVHERQGATLAAELFAAEMGVDYIRTHDTASLHDALIIMEKLREEP